MTRPLPALALAVALPLGLAACSAPATPSPAPVTPTVAAPATPTVTVTVTSSPTATVGATPTTTGPSATTSSTAPTTAARPVTPTPSPSARRVTLGIKLPMTANLGTVKPTSFAASGHPTAMVDQIVWNSWGGPTAEGTGRASWVGPGRSTAEGEPSTVRIIAGEPKLCNGQYAYSKVRWWFPEHPESKSSTWSFDLCSR